MTDQGWVVINLIILIANFAVLAMSLKLYTEYFKDKSADNRGKERK